LLRRLAPPETVILRESGVSSTPQLLDSITGASEYWIARRSLSSGGHSADPLAGDDGWACAAFAFNELPPAPVIARSEATKQSMPQQKMDCFAALAMTTNRDSKHTFATSRREAPEALDEISRPIEGVGNCINGVA